ncbi:hypothetical protein BpHYR1_013010 [Brachionus plicatilis]|uniref:Uncharacterized protein n=1 Tax=Brachionus plicatilis TaxID=10195 RepID=A0A3M7QGF1_BRAPC|nr:hypothetical protein BpHYR1_013010 [Brachionus plicatilis]
MGETLSLYEFPYYLFLNHILSLLFKNLEKACHLNRVLYFKYMSLNSDDYIIKNINSLRIHDKN